MSESPRTLKSRPEDRVRVTAAPSLLERRRDRGELAHRRSEAGGGRAGNTKIRLKNHKGGSGWAQERGPALTAAVRVRGADKRGVVACISDAIAVADEHEVAIACSESETRDERAKLSRCSARRETNLAYP